MILNRGGYGQGAVMDQAGAALAAVELPSALCFPHAFSGAGPAVARLSTNEACDIDATGEAMKNPDNIEALDLEKHRNLRVKPNPDFVHAKELNLAAITQGEIGATACNFPIVFIPNPDTKLLRPVALFGLRPGENVYYGKDGWDTTYHPLVIQRHPFVIGWDDRAGDGKTLAPCLNRNSPFISEAEGIALFKPSGEETDFLQSRFQLLQEIFEGERFTETFARRIGELGLLIPLEIIVQPEQGEPRRVTGMYALDERKLKALTPEQVQELHQQDMLPACYIILGSLFQLHKLMKLRHDKGIERLQSYRIEFPSDAPVTSH